MFYFSVLWIFFFFKVCVSLSWKRRQSKFTVNTSLETNLLLQIRWTFKPLWGGFAQWTTAGVFPLLMFALKKKKKNTFFHFSIQISEKKKNISDGGHPPAENRCWLWPHAVGWLGRSNAGFGRHREVLTSYLWLRRRLRRAPSIMIPSSFCFPFI